MRANRVRVLVYRDHLLPISETFVANQSLHLVRHEAYFLGSKIRRGSRIELPPERIQVINHGGRVGVIREIAFKLLGFVPSDIMEWVRSLRAALVHAHFAPDGALAIPLARKLELPLVVSLHGTDVTMRHAHVWRSSYPTHKLYLLRRRALFEYASAFVVPSEFLRAKALERGFPEDKIHLIRHGIDLELFRPSQAAPEWGSVLYVGRLVEVKGLRFLIEALSRVRREFPEVRLTIIGDGPRRAEYEALAREKLGTGFEFLGAQLHPVVREYLKRAYLFSMPSVALPTGETESFGLVLVEAQAMGVPVVAFASGGIPEVVAHGETGFLAPERDVEALAHYIATLLREPQLRKRMGEAGRARVEQIFDLRKNNAVLESLYSEVVKG